MIHEPIEKALDTLARAETLSLEERVRMRRVISEYAAFKPIRTPAARATRRFDELLSALTRAPFASALAVILVVSATSVSLASAAESALPGEFLYSMKLQIVEPARLSLAQTVETKRAWEQRFAERRLTEAAVLADQGLLDTSTEAILTANFEHYANLVLATSEEETASATETEIAVDNFFARLDAYATVFDQIDESRGTVVAGGLRTAIRTQATKATLPMLREADEPHTTRLMLAADEALNASTELVEALPQHFATTTSERVRQVLNDAKMFRKEGDDLLKNKDLNGASRAFKNSLRTTSRLSVLTEAATTLEIDAFDPATTSVSTSTTKNEESPGKSDSPKHED